jgi:branched-chain amino acid transport system permease protein
MARWRPYILGILGVAALTFPFLWLQLAPNFDKNTVGVIWAPMHGLEFFGDLSTVFVVGFLIWLWVQLNRRFAWSAALARIPVWQKIEHLAENYGVWLAIVLVLLVVPMSIRPNGSEALRSAGFPWISTSTLGMFTFVGLYMLLAVGLNITVGMTGLLVLGYAGFYAFGAYFFALGQQYFFFPWWLAGPLAFVFGGAAGYLLGLPCLRLRGDYLAIVTLGFAEAFRELMRNLSFSDDDLKGHGEFVQGLMHFFNTGGDKGIVLKDSSIFQGFAGLSNQQVCYAVTAMALGATVFFIQRIYHSPVGRAWIAIRENEVAAEAMGVPVVQMKLLAFSLSAAVAAVAGVIYGAKDGFVSPAMCEFQQSIMILAMVILGGLGNSYGALLGAALLYLVPEYLKALPSTIQGNSVLSAIVPQFVRDSFQHLSDYRWLLFGAVMVLMMLYRPQGLLGSSRRKTEMLNR